MSDGYEDFAAVRKVTEEIEDLSPELDGSLLKKVLKLGSSWPKLQQILQASVQIANYSQTLGDPSCVLLGDIGADIRNLSLLYKKNVCGFLAGHHGQCKALEVVAATMQVGEVAEVVVKSSKWLDRHTFDMPVVFIVKVLEALDPSDLYEWLRSDLLESFQQTLLQQYQNIQEQRCVLTLVRGQVVHGDREERYSGLYSRALWRAALTSWWKHAQAITMDSSSAATHAEQMIHAATTAYGRLEAFLSHSASEYDYDSDNDNISENNSASDVPLEANHLEKSMRDMNVDVRLGRPSQGVSIQNVSGFGVRSSVVAKGLLSRTFEQLFPSSEPLLMHMKTGVFDLLFGPSRPLELLAVMACGDYQVVSIDNEVTTTNIGKIASDIIQDVRATLEGPPSAKVDFNGLIGPLYVNDIPGGFCLLSTSGSRSGRGSWWKFSLSDPQTSSPCLCPFPENSLCIVQAKDDVVFADASVVAVSMENKWVAIGFEQDDAILIEVRSLATAKTLHVHREPLLEPEGDDYEIILSGELYATQGWLFLQRAAAFYLVFERNPIARSVTLFKQDVEDGTFHNVWSSRLPEGRLQMWDKGFTIASFDVENIYKPKMGYSWVRFYHFPCEQDVRDEVSRLSLPQEKFHVRDVPGHPYARIESVIANGELVVTRAFDRLTQQSLAEVWDRRSKARVLAFPLPNDPGSGLCSFWCVTCLSCSTNSNMISSLCSMLSARNEIEETSMVIEDVQYSGDDLPTVILPEEASRVTAELWAASVDGMNQKQTSSDDQSKEQTNRILLLTFSRNPKELEEAILASGPAQAAIRAGINVKPAWAGGGKVLVDICASQLEPPTITFDLRPWHVLLKEEDEPELFSSLQPLPYNVRKLRPQGKSTIIVPEALSLFSMSSTHSEPMWPMESESIEEAHSIMEIQVRHTFVHYKESLDTRTVQTW